MSNKQQQDILDNQQNKCNCSEDDNCGCTYPNNTLPDYESKQGDNSQIPCNKKRSASKKA